MSSDHKLIRPRLIAVLRALKASGDDLSDSAETPDRHYGLRCEEVMWIKKSWK